MPLGFSWKEIAVGVPVGVISVGFIASYFDPISEEATGPEISTKMEPIAELAIPSDPHARYEVLAVGIYGGHKTLLTKRNGPSGSSFSEILIDCKNQKFAYMREGETLNELMADPQMPTSGWSRLVPNSIKDYQFRYTCGSI